MAWGMGGVSGKARGIFEVPGTEVAIPYTDVRGAADGPTLLLSGGVHGGEYPGIAAAIEVASRLDPARLRGRVIVLHLVNPPAFWGKMQYWNPLDGKNLNRCFPGDPQGTASERIAARVVGVLKESGADYWIDMHGGDIHEELVPFTIFSDRGGVEVAARAEAMARAYGIPRLLRSSSVAGSTYQAAAELGVPAILPEAGQTGRLEWEAVTTHVDGVLRVLDHLDLLPEARPMPEETRIYTRFLWTRAARRGLWRANVHPGSTVEQGDVAGTLRDVYGDLQEEVLSPAAGEVLFTASSFAIGEDDPLFAVAAP